MWDICTEIIATACLLTATLGLFPPPLLFHEAHNSQAPTTATVEQAGCGTMDSAFGDDHCLRLQFDDEVSKGETFEERFGGSLLFRLNPEQDSSGWTMEVIPESQAGNGKAEYVWVVNVPYRSYNVRYLNTSYGTSASEAVAFSPRDFNFVLNEQQFKRASELVDTLIMSRPQSDHRSEEEVHKEWQDAMQALSILPVAKGRLTILKSRVRAPANEDDFGSIEWLKFKVELHVPCGFSTIKGAPQVSVDETKCSGDRKQSQK